MTESLDNGSEKIIPDRMLERVHKLQRGGEVQYQDLLIHLICQTKNHQKVDRRLLELKINPCSCGNIPLCLFLDLESITLLNMFMDQSKSFTSISTLYDLLSKNNLINYSKRTLYRKLDTLDPFLLKVSTKNFVQNTKSEFFLNPAFGMNDLKFSSISFLCPLNVNNGAFQIIKFLLYANDWVSFKEICAKLLTCGKKSTLNHCLTRLLNKQIVFKRRMSKHSEYCLNKLHPFNHQFENMEKLF